LQASHRGQAKPGRGGFSSQPGIKGSKPVKRSGKGKRFRLVARTLGSMDGEPANHKKRQDESSDIGLRRISMTVGLSSLRTLERETGFEPATSTLARSHSTTELLPHRKLLFILCPRVLSTGRGYEISNVSFHLLLFICHLAYPKAIPFNAKCLLGDFWAMPNAE
jgi:hypothetical protein